MWLNLFLPSVKLVKKVRVGSKVRRVYDGPRTPLERVKACREVQAEKLAWLEEQRKRWDPFQLARIIDRKLERIYRLANRRLSPKEIQKASWNRGAPEKRLWESGNQKHDFHFPTAATATNLRLHFKCLDDHH